MKLIKTQDAVGKVLCHDITQIIKDVRKGPVFKKGHIIREEDISVLLSCGKENVYVLELGTDDEAEFGRGMVHENEAAEFLCSLSRGSGLGRGDVREGKIELTAEYDGLLKIDEKGILAINTAGEMMIASRHGNFPVRKGDRIAGMRIIPLVIAREKLTGVRDVILKLQKQEGHTDPDRGDIPAPLFNILPFRPKRAAIIATGSEIQKGLIEDTFTPVVEKKLSEYGNPVETVYRSPPGDDHTAITAEIMKAVKEYDADIVLCTGGMSVDPDDRTPLAVRNTGASIVCYGAPVLPGAMFMLGYLERDDRDGPVAVMGLPGCVMFHGRTIFDLVLPRIMADDPVSSADIERLGSGGLCLNCEVCTFPNCGFGK